MNEKQILLDRLNKIHTTESVIYIHGQGGNAEEANYYKHLFKDGDVIGFDYKAQTPREAKEEFPFFFDPLCSKYKSVILIANSIGAYFSMHALADRKIAKAFLISPIVDMEELILNMMDQAGVTEEELREKKEIPAASGAVLSWNYLSYVKAHPIEWRIPTEILYGEKDVMTSFETISGFADRSGAGLTVMKDGEHWFHTEEQMAFVDMWLRKCLVKK